jgi:hypothetical protein
VLEIVANFRQIGGKNEIDPTAGDKKWILGAPCSPDWRQEIKFIGRQIAMCWRQENEIPGG